MCCFHYFWAYFIVYEYYKVELLVYILAEGCCYWSQFLTKQTKYGHPHMTKNTQASSVYLTTVLQLY